MTTILNPIRFAGGYIIEGSGLFDGSTGYLSRTQIAGDEKTWTMSIVFKINEPAPTAVGGNYLFSAGNNSPAGNTDYLVAVMRQTGGDINFSGATTSLRETTRVFRDTAGWGHLVIRMDTTQATAADRHKMWWNGTEITDFDTNNNLALNALTAVGKAKDFRIGSDSLAGGRYADFYVAEHILLDGVAAEPADFGEVIAGGFWQINNPSGLDYTGANSHRLSGGTDVAAGTDSSGNGNDFTPAGTITSTSDSCTNDAVNGYGNYATLNPLEANAGTLSNGNLTCTTQHFKSTLALPTTGKWYWEITCDAQTSGTSVYGIADKVGNTAGAPQARIIRVQNGDKYSTDVASWQAYGTSWTATDIIGFAVDMDNGAIYVSKNGTFYNGGDPTSGASKTGAMFTDLLSATIDTAWFPGVYCGDGSNIATANFGQTSFNTAAPTDFKALATQNFPAPDVPNYEDEYYIEAGISHTNGATTAVTLPKTVSGGAMARIKRTDAAGDWFVVDTVRGANTFSKWNTNFVEDTSTWTDQNLTGTTLTLPSALATGTYLIEMFYVGSYFQIKTWTGTTAAQTITWDTALDTETGFHAVIPRNQAYSPVAWHKSLSSDDHTLFLDGTGAELDRNNFSAHAATGCTAQADASATDININGDTYVSYGWANGGPYAFGSYTGNLNADGPVINVRGSPEAFMTKRNEAGWNWVHHAQVNGANENYQYLIPHTTAAINATTTVNEIDFLSTGYKVRDGGNNNINGSGIEHLYMAFGITPIQGPDPSSSPNQERAV